MYPVSGSVVVVDQRNVSTRGSPVCIEKLFTVMAFTQPAPQLYDAVHVVFGDDRLI